MALYWDLTDSSNYDTDPVLSAAIGAMCCETTLSLPATALSPAAKSPTATRQVMQGKSRRAG